MTLGTGAGRSQPHPPPSRARASAAASPSFTGSRPVAPRGRGAAAACRRRHAGRPGAAALERVGELGRAGEAVGRQLLQRDEDGALDLGRDGVPLRQDGPGRLGQDPGHDRLRGRSGEGGVAGEHLVQHHAQRVDVRAGGDLPLAHRLLGRHVVRRSQRHTGLRHPVPAGLARRQRDAEVGHQRLTVVEQDVLGLDVAVDHPVPVGVVERGGYLDRDPDRLGDGELLLPAEPGPERLTLDEGHDVEEESVGLPRVEEGEDVGVLEIGGQLDLGQEPLGADDRRELGAEEFQRDPPVVAEVLGQEDGGHAAGADLALDPVAVGQGELEPGLRLGHGGRLVVGMA